MEYVHRGSAHDILERRSMGAELPWAAWGEVAVPFVSLNLPIRGSRGSVLPAAAGACGGQDETASHRGER